MARTRFVRRFSGTERALHWVHASAFLVMLGSGLILYLPRLTELVSRRPLIKAVHLYTAVAWVLLLLLIVAAGDRRGLRRTLREIDLFDRDDRRWLLGRRAPQGRFNAGQKLHAAVQAAIAVLFLVSGLFLWYGERDTRFRLPGAILLHDGLMYAFIVLVGGHLFLTLVYPRTRHSLRGMTLGSVREDWARKHHPKWVAGLSRGSPEPIPAAAQPGPPLWRRPGLWVFAASLALLVAAFAGIASLRHLLPGAGPSGGDFAARAASPVSQSPRVALAVSLFQHARELEQAGVLEGAITLYRKAVETLPEHSDFRTAYGFALARAGREREALVQLRRAVRLDPSYAPARLYLGALLIEQGERARARLHLRRYLELAPIGEGAALARRLLREP